MPSYEEYLEEIKKTRGGFLDKFSNVDERVDYAVRRLDELEAHILTVKEHLMMSERLENLTIDFLIPITTALRVNDVQGAPLDGTVYSVQINWPDGCNGLVDVAVYHGTTQFVPRSGFLALNNVNPVFPTNERVQFREPMYLDLRNRDGGFPHRITVTYHLRGPA